MFDRITSIQTEIWKVERKKQIEPDPKIIDKMINNYNSKDRFPLTSSGYKELFDETIKINEKIKEYVV